MTNIHQFTLLLDGVKADTPNLEDSLFEAGCDDALINTKSGTVYLDFDREGETLEKAIISAINDVESASINALVVSIEPEHLVSVSDIAKRLSISKQAVSMFVHGERGDGDFPNPVLKIQSKSALWKWSSVAKWLFNQGKINDPKIIEDAQTIEDINFALNGRSKKTMSHYKEISNSLTKKHAIN